MPDLPDRIPHHVAIIMDGNGRWAKQRGKMRYEGHQAGTENLRRTLRACTEFGIKILTIYAFSTENWGRPPREVAFLMRILESVLDRELDELHANGVQIRHLGLFDQVAPLLAKKINGAIERTRWNDRLILNVAFNYGGRNEIVQAVRRIAQEGIPAEQIDESLMGYYMFTGGLPDPDLIIRTSGEYRTSNFLIWQGAYSEYYFSPTYWPDFDRGELLKAIQAYASRERRYGLVEPPPEAAE